MDSCGLFDLTQENFFFLRNCLKLNFFLLGNNELLILDGRVQIVLNNVHAKTNLGQLDLKCLKKMIQLSNGHFRIAKKFLPC